MEVVVSFNSKRCCQMLYFVRFRTYNCDAPRNGFVSHCFAEGIAECVWFLRFLKYNSKMWTASDIACFANQHEWCLNQIDKIIRRSTQWMGSISKGCVFNVKCPLCSDFAMFWKCMEIVFSMESVNFEPLLSISQKSHYCISILQNIILTQCTDFVLFSNVFKITETIFSCKRFK